MFVDGMVMPVPRDKLQQFKNMSFHIQGAFMENGAQRYVDCVGVDVPDGEKTSFPMAVDLQPGEVAMFCWIEWPDKDTRDKGMKAMMEDPRMKDEELSQMPFDGKRMIFGGFEVMLEG